MSNLAQLGKFKTAKSGTVYSNIDDISDQDFKDTCLRGVNSGAKEPIMWDDQWFVVVPRDNGILVYAFGEDEQAADKFAAWKPDPNRTPQSSNRQPYNKNSSFGNKGKSGGGYNKPFGAAAKSKYRTYTEPEEVLKTDYKKQEELRSKGKQILTPQFLGNNSETVNAKGEKILTMGKVIDVEV